MSLIFVIGKTSRIWTSQKTCQYPFSSQLSGTKVCKKMKKQYQHLVRFRGHPIARQDTTCPGGKPDLHPEEILRGDFAGHRREHVR